LTCTPFAAVCTRVPPTFEKWGIGTPTSSGGAAHVYAARVHQSPLDDNRWPTRRPSGV